MYNLHYRYNVPRLYCSDLPLSRSARPLNSSCYLRLLRRATEKPSKGQRGGSLSPPCLLHLLLQSLMSRFRIHALQSHYYSLSLCFRCTFPAPVAPRTQKLDTRG